MVNLKTVNQRISFDYCRGWNDAVKAIGRCGECSYREKATVNNKGFLICPASGMEITNDDFCSYFEPKEYRK